TRSASATAAGATTTRCSCAASSAGIPTRSRSSAKSGATCVRSRWCRERRTALALSRAGRSPDRLPAIRLSARTGCVKPRHGLAREVAQAFAAGGEVGADLLAHARRPEPPKMAGDRIGGDAAVGLAREEGRDVVRHADQRCRVHGTGLPASMRHGCAYATWLPARAKPTRVSPLLAA